MGKRIRELVEQYALKKGRTGRAKLCDAVNRSERTVFDLWMKKGIPSAELALKLALACECGEKEALRLAREEALAAANKKPA